MLLVELDGPIFHILNRCVRRYVPTCGVDYQLTDWTEGLQLRIGQPYGKAPTRFGLIIIGYAGRKSIGQMGADPFIGCRSSF